MPKLVRVKAPEARRRRGVRGVGRGKTRGPLECFWAAGSGPTPSPALHGTSIALPWPSPPHQGPQHPSAAPASPPHHPLGLKLYSFRLGPKFAAPCLTASSHSSPSGHLQGPAELSSPL